MYTVYILSLKIQNWIWNLQDQSVVVCVFNIDGEIYIHCSELYLTSDGIFSSSCIFLISTSAQGLLLSTDP